MGGWIAKIFLLLLVASFAVWGVGGSLGSGSGTSVVSVGETKVGLLEYRLAYDRQLNQLQQQLGSQITREQANSLGLSQNVLTQVVSGALIDENARIMGLGISNDKLASLIGEDEAFRDATGRFSRQLLQQVLRSIGMSEEDYVKTREAVAVRNQLIEGVSANTALPDAFWNILESYQAEQRKFNYVTVTSAEIDPIGEPDDAALKTYYDANLANYMAPEFRKLNVVKLEAADIADPTQITEDEIKADYEIHKAGFTLPEKRTIEQLVFADQAKAEAALAQLKAGTGFDVLLQNEGKTPADVSLGTLTKTDIPDAKIAEAAFSLAANQTSDLVEGIFGPVILRVTAIQPGSTKPLESVRDEIAKSLALAKAAEDIFDIHDKFEDERAAGENLETAAKVTGLKMRVVEAIDRTARDPEGNIINDLPQSQQLIAEAFDTDPGTDLNPLPIGSEGFAWLEVVSVTPERQKTLEEVRSQLVTDWKGAETAKAIDARAETIRSRVAGGEDFNAVIGELMPVAEGQSVRVIQQTPALVRTASSSELTPQALTQGFTQPKGAVFVAPSVKPESRSVYQIGEVLAGSIVKPGKEVIDSYNGSLVDDFTNQMISKMQENVEVSINQQAVAAALAR
jgi:peptidyl-prolyl cis-trans isomerase D